MVSDGPLRALPRAARCCACGVGPSIGQGTLGSFEFQESRYWPNDQFRSRIMGSDYPSLGSGRRDVNKRPVAAQCGSARSRADFLAVVSPFSATILAKARACRLPNDSAGRLVSLAYSLGVITQSFDAVGRVTVVKLAHPASRFTYQYDAGGF